MAKVQTYDVVGQDSFLLIASLHYLTANVVYVIRPTTVQLRTHCVHQRYKGRQKAKVS